MFHVLSNEIFLLQKIIIQRIIDIPSTQIFSALKFEGPPENNLHFPWGQFRIIYVLCRNCMVGYHDLSK